MNNTIYIHRFYAIFALLSGLIFSVLAYAGIDRFWLKDNTERQINTCKNLDKAQQQQLIQAYQAIHDEQKKLDLKQRMAWFCQLSTEQQEKMRTAWQNLSSKQRDEIKKRLTQAENADEREKIRQEILEKYGHIE